MNPNLFFKKVNIPRLNDKIELSFNFEGEILNSCFLQKTISFTSR